MTWSAGQPGARTAIAGAQVDVLVQGWPDEPGAGDVDLLDAAERSRLDQFSRRRDAAGFATGHALVRRAAAMRLGCGPGQVRLTAPPGRRPRIASASLACSIAHGGRVVVAAVVEAGAVGVDVEPVDLGIPADDLAWIARQVLGASAAEVAALRSGAEPASAFLVRWTLTEAVLKALGTGLSADPGEVRLDLRQRPRLLSAPGVGPAAAASWGLFLLQVAPGHVAALACDRPIAPPRVVRLD